MIRLLDRSLDRILHKGEPGGRLGGEAFVEDLCAQDQRHRVAHLDHPLLVLHSPRNEVVRIESAGTICQADHLLTRVADPEYSATLIAAWMPRFVPMIDQASG